MRLGINHHLLFPASFEDVIVHRETFPIALSLEAFEVIDMFIPVGGEVEREMTDLLLKSGKEAVYNCPLMVGDHLNPHSSEERIRQQTLETLYVHLDRAKRLKSKKVGVASGIDPGVLQRKEQTQWFVEYLVAACQYAAPELEVIIEPFDRSIGKNLLIGSSVEAREVVEAVQNRGHHNIGIMIDMGHIPIMGETFEHATKVLAPFIRHVHLGSCLINDRPDPLYGDMHPPWGYPGGENDVKETADFLECLFKEGILGEGKRPSITLEMRPYPGVSEVDSVNIFIEKLDEAWKLCMIEDK
jgi:sugar phosphate isomerase/epimerase